MSVFRPSVRATGPDGRMWEIYSYKLKLRRRGDGAKRRAPRRLRDTVVAAVRALRSDEWTIEAVTWLPYKESHAWTTTDEYRGQVLAQVEGSLVRGDVPLRVGHAIYRR